MPICMRVAMTSLRSNGSPRSSGFGDGRFAGLCPDDGLPCSAVASTSLGIAPESVRPLRRCEYEQLIQSGAFEGERVELLYGVVVQMSPHGTRHDGVVQRLTRLLLLGLDPRAGVRIQSAFAAASGSQPEPDVAVVAPGDYLTAHPSSAHLIIEVADSSLPIDHGLKAKLY